jgi:hypothetical protein
MFRFTKKPSSGSLSQNLAKITSLVQCRYRRCQCYGGIICFTLVERDSGTHCISEWMVPRFDTPVPTEYRSGWVSESIIRYPLTIRVNGSEGQDPGTHWISEWMDPRVDTSVPTENQIGWIPDSVLRSENFDVDKNVFLARNRTAIPLFAFRPELVLY